MTLEELNKLEPARATEEFFRCSGSRRWAEKLVWARPFSTREDLFNLGEAAWTGFTREDWLEAFASHPRIGSSGDRDSLREKFASTAKWASEEQRGAARASEETLTRLAEANADYERRFGHIFIVCATGKSAGQMLAILEDRMKNAPDKELLVAAREQAKITHIRLEKLLS